MKNLLISLSIFLIIIAAILTYGIYSYKITTTLEDFAKSPTSLSDANDAYSYWQRHSALIRTGVNTPFTDNVTLSFISLRAALESGDSEDVRKSIENLQFYISELKRVNCVHWENIL